MSRAGHWEQAHRSKPTAEVSWYAPHLDRSLAFIRAVAGTSAEIIDVGGGASTLVDDLRANEYRHVTVLDISGAALEISRRRLGVYADGVTWLVADVTTTDLPEARYDVWHDRAVFHFLTEAADRAAYAQRAARSIRPGGHLIAATFALDGPVRCSGLDVIRYDAATLGHALGPAFALRQEAAETHVTPGGREQRFLYTLFERV